MNEKKMPKYRKCCVTGCTSSAGTDKTRSFYRFPQVSSRTKQNLMFKIHHEKSVIIKKRRAAWIKAINRENFVVRVFTAVCSLHFHSGKPAVYRDEGNIDWVPSLFMNGENNFTNKERDEESQNATAYSFTSTADATVEDNYITIKEEVLTDGSFEDEEGQEISCDLSMTSTENDPLDVQTAVHPPDPNTTDGVTGCFVDAKRPMVTIVSPELLRDTTFSENPSTAVQCAIDEDNRIIVKTEIMDMEDEVPLNTGPNLTYSLISTSMADNGTQVDFDEPPSPIQLDKSTQTEMSSFPKPRGTE
ncbi:uncharacterized protein LOC124313247 isoform X2 [Daphnia pulicaria]|uniref:uncharacterized protein LOC124313247 isoform X2 n=1 Tax=Daphnia pulicaria TaxID=35523 RepID=UPI001EEB531F|nr:uncharacterized protein LOC124313247 isoform X2 [Daphnia pulicaria]